MFVYCFHDWFRCCNVVVSRFRFSRNFDCMNKTPICYIYMSYSQLRLCPPPFLRRGHIYMKDAHCAETNEKSIFRFFFWVMVNCVYNFWRLTIIFKCITDKKIFVQKWPNLHEICEMCWNEWKKNFLIFAIFSFWDMVVFVHKIGQFFWWILSKIKK